VGERHPAFAGRAMLAVSWTDESDVVLQSYPQKAQLPLVAKRGQ
jgi:hypothetical protein